MNIKLIDSDEKTVLSVQTEHTLKSDREILPATFEGNKSLLLRPDTTKGTVSSLVILFREASLRHKLEMRGDYSDFENRDNLIY